ncbi:hypothetical protein EV646_106379 [Kribbella antiqua]|uniref:Uncharacterized protein n=1 Tax=Kribbella antiqua TaxID=2512217 RepID=A0A4R2ISJ3_9ACTN|nr:hypothetical protein [Kribbella antiqua]TCO47139.1 hypothetical protein EV646_106379 [Kribbella antiqua]
MAERRLGLERTLLVALATLAVCDRRGLASGCTGNPNLATDLLNSGRPALANAAQSWVQRTGYTIVSRGGVAGATWGVF